MTSSIAAVRSERASSADAPFTEADWTDGDDSARTPYVRSKTLAEQAAWEHMRAAGAEDRLATVSPGAIIGPALNDDHSYSLEVIQRLLDGMPAVPKLGFTFVDVRDVADLHIRAMTDPKAAGERFIAAGNFAWMADLATLLRARLGKDAAKVPTGKVPDFVIRIAGLFDKDLGSVTPNLGHKHDYSSEKAQRMLGWKPRPLEETVLDCARSLIATGAV
jgi:nucleoside-diphosphate-sugar epimerase